jgi:hypothetical protein
MTKRVRRNHSRACKAGVDSGAALPAVKNAKTVADLTRQFDVHVNQITPLRRPGRKGPPEYSGLEPRPAPLQRWL